jgi:hypothetical protein
MATTSLDAQILELVKEASPSGAYLMGFNDYAGRLFIASQANIDKTLTRARVLRKHAKTELQRKILDSIEVALMFDEPQPVLDDIVGTIFAHLVKEGINEDHMSSLLRLAELDIDACAERFSGRKIPVAVKALTLYRLGGVFEMLDTVKGEAKSEGLKRQCDSVKAKAAEYVKLFALEGFGRGEFPNVEKIFAEHGSDLDRKSFYPKALKAGFDYSESPGQLEKKALKWIDEELPKMQKVTEKLAAMFGCEATPVAVEERINGRMKLDPKQLIKTTQDIRKVIRPFVNEDVHGINPKYNTTVMETPPYLSGTIPTGAAQFFDTYTSKPFQIFFQTTDPKRDPDKSVAALIDLLVHEEYGHCVHHSNSAVGFVGKLPALQLLAMAPTSGPITEGLSFNRELEFMEASKALEKKKSLTKAEKAYVAQMEKYGGLKQINLEVEFMTRRWRIIRFLRVLGDVWVNTGKKDLIAFVDWAHEHTGMPRSSVYFQLFPAHEGIFPGYATTYAVMGQEIRAIEKGIRDPKKRVKFSTYLCSIGFPPRSIYRRMLRDYAAKLK